MLGLGYHVPNIVMMVYPCTLPFTLKLILQVTGLQALKSFSGHFLEPYVPKIKKGSVEELELRITELNLQLKTAEEELEKLRKGKQKV